MEALEFLKEHKRMCKAYKTCNNCPLSNNHCIVNHLASDYDNKKIVNFVEHWSKEHPRKTLQSVFLEQWPNATVLEDGVINIRPCNLDVNVKKGCLGVTCLDCRREFWMQEVE